MPSQLEDQDARPVQSELLVLTCGPICIETRLSRRWTEMGDRRSDIVGHFEGRLYLVQRALSSRTVALVVSSIMHGMVEACPFIIAESRLTRLCRHYQQWPNDSCNR